MEAKADARDDSVRTTVQNLISECDNLLAELGDEGARRYRDAVTGLQRQMRRARDDLDDLQYSARTISASASFGRLENSSLELGRIGSPGTTSSDLTSASANS